MTVSAAQAAKHIGELSSWTLSNLSVQKLLYIAHMVFLGENGGSPLIREDFEAWDYGPVVPSLYHKMKIFGGDPVKDVFYENRPIAPSCPEAIVIKRAVDSLAKERPAKLVSITHWDQGAWAKYYIKDVHGIRIPNAAILEEFQKRFPEEAR